MCTVRQPGTDNQEPSTTCTRSDFSSIIKVSFVFFGNVEFTSSSLLGSVWSSQTGTCPVCSSVWSQPPLLCFKSHFPTPPLPPPTSSHPHLDKIQFCNFVICRIQLLSVTSISALSLLRLISSCLPHSYYGILLTLSSPFIWMWYQRLYFPLNFL